MKRVHNRQFFQAIGHDLVCTLMVLTVELGAHMPFFKCNTKILLETKMVVNSNRILQKSHLTPLRGSLKK